MGVTQQGLADLLEVSRNTIKAWERGDPKRQPHILTQEAVLARLTKASEKATQ
jgi:DNA-binding XRE family transcriptional regulator